MDETVSSGKSDQADRWKAPKDFLEPQYYPDPVLFRLSLENQSRADQELMKNLASNKATIRVLAPYLNIMRKEKKRIIETAMKKKGDKTKQSTVFFDKKVKEGLVGEVQGLEEKVELVLSIHETADVLKLLLDANYTVTYLTNLEKNEIYQSPRHVVSSTINLTWNIELKTTMAAHAAFTKRYVVTSNISSDDRFPLGLGFPSSNIQYALCVPIKTPDDKVIAVYELARDSSKLAFDNRDVQIVLAIAGWMGVAILQNWLYSALAKQQDLNNYLLQLTNQYHFGENTVEKTLSDLTIFARETIGAEKGNIFVVDKVSKGTIILQEYDQGIEYSKGLLKRRTKRSVKKDDSFLSKVVFNKEVVEDKTDVSDMTLSDGENFIRSILCAPIICNNETLGAIQLTNKKGAVQFSQEDKVMLQTFAGYCAVNLNLLKFHESHKKLELQNKITSEMLFHHIKPCSHDQEALKKSSSELPDQFFTFAWYPSPDEMPKLVEYTINMFQEVLGDSFMALNNIPKFILTVKNCYRPNPYHNFLHAFCVTHAMANIVSRYHHIFTGVERKGLMIAALCHDVDHRGYNNNFIQLTRHYLSSLYESSPLENHHFAITKLILQECGMFKYIKPAMFEELLAEIYECIIATDLSLYFQGKMELKRIADEKTFTFKDPDHRRLVKSLMMSACDLSGQTKPMSICQKITEDVYEEFFLQGDVEKKMGYLPLPTMDRDMKDLIAENQVQFLSVVVLPCVETVSRIFGTLSPMVWDCKILVSQWKDLVLLKDQDTWKPDESIVSKKV